MALIHLMDVSDVLIYTSAATILYIIVKRVKKPREVQTTPLPGPPSESYIYGAYKRAFTDEEPSARFSDWVKEYGPVISVPGSFGRPKVVLLDPRAASHFYAGETWTYQRAEFGRTFVARLFGRGLLWAEAHDHKRQRKALTPAFSVAAIRRLTSVFFDSAYKAKSAWDAIIDSSGSEEAVIEVQDWMNRISLDSIGIAGFSHDFKTLSGSTSTVLDFFYKLGSPAGQQSKLGLLFFMLALKFPKLSYLPTKYNQMLAKLKIIMSDVADVLLERTRSEKSAMAETSSEEKSIIGLLIKAENQNAELKMSEEEVLAQMNVLLFAGFETTSASLTWALIELCRNDWAQKRLREELLECGSGDPTYEQMMNGLPFLDAVVHEVLRLHPPVNETIRVATEDDTIPLSNPIKTSTGKIVSSILIAKGTVVSAPIRWFNRSEEFWGSDASTFNPLRWLDENKERGAKEINGYRKLLTFSDGARICLGKMFALAEFKAVLCTLVRHYEFRFKDGVEGTKIGRHPSLLPRAKIVGEEGMNVPLVVRRLD